MRSCGRRFAIGVSAAALLAGSAGFPAQAVSIRDDVGQAAGGIGAYYDSANVYANVVSLRRGGASTCTATLLDARTLLTAAHCFEDDDAVQADRIGPQMTVSFSPQSSDAGAALVQSVAIAPGFRPGEGNLGLHDIAIVALDRPITDIAPVRLPTGQPVPGGTVVIVGYGGAFLGSSPQAYVYDGRRRVAFNVLDFVGPGVQLPPDSDGNPMAGTADPGWVVLAVDFDNPDDPAYSSLGSPLALPLEGAPVAGDSGGPLFLLQPDGSLVQIGVLSGGDATAVAKFVAAQISPDTAYTGYGDLEIWTNLAAYLDWLADSAFVRPVQALPGDGSWSDAAHWSGGAVPNNSVGYVADGGARYYEVSLVQPGTTLLDSNARIDRLVVAHPQAALQVPAGLALASEIGTSLWAGSLELDGTLATPWLRLAGGTLGGSGRLVTGSGPGQGLSQTGGTISPGGSGAIGTLSVSGSFVQTGGVLLAEIAGQASDRLEVSGGTAQLAGGLQIALLGATPPDAGSRLTLVTAEGLSAASLADPPPVGAVTFTLLRGETELAVEIGRLPLADIGADEDQDAVAAALDTQRGNPAFEPVFDALDLLPPAQIRQALEEMSEVSTASGAIAQLGSTQFLGAATQRVGALRRGGTAAPEEARLALAALAAQDPADAAWALADAGTATRPARPRSAGPVDALGGMVAEGPVLALGGGMEGPGGAGAAGDLPWGVWLQPHGSRALRRGADAGSRYDASLGGFAAGLDYRLGDGLVVGASLGYARADLGYLDNDSASRVRSYHGGLYAGWWQGPWSAEAAFGLGLNRYEHRREIAFGTIATAAEGRTDGLEASAYVEGRYRFDLRPKDLPALELEPLASLQVLRLAVDGYTESGAGVLNLTVGDDTVTSIRTGLGFALAMPVQLEGGVRLRPELRGRWLHEFADIETVVDARFAAAPAAAFQVASDRLGRNAALLGAGLEAQFSPALAASAGYDAQLQSGLTVHAVTARLRLAF